MSLCTWIIIGWLIFDFIVFIWAWWDDFYFSHDVKGVFRRLKEAVTEE